MPSPSSHQIDVGLGPRQAVPGLFLIVLLLAMAVGALVGWLGTDDRSGGLLAFAAVCAVLAGLIGWLTVKVLRPRTLIVDAEGIRLADSGPRPFTVGWGELAEVRVSYAFKAGQFANKLAIGSFAPDAVPGEGPDPPVGVSVLTRLDLIPADANFLDRHPEMARWQDLAKVQGPVPTSSDWVRAPSWSAVPEDRQPVLRIVLGPIPHVVVPIDEALRDQAGDRYGPPVNEGIAWGFRYS